MGILQADYNYFLSWQLHGKKRHIRALLIDRVLLQHEVGRMMSVAYSLDQLDVG